MRSLLGIVFLFTQIIFPAQAQRICGTGKYTETLVEKNASSKRGYAIAADQIAARAGVDAQILARDTTDQVIYIPIVIHVLYNESDQNISDKQIQSQLNALNEDYSHTNSDAVNTPTVFAPLAADTRIRFCLARVDPQGKKTSGVLRKYTSAKSFDLSDAMKNDLFGGDKAWDCKRYLNIWICNLSGRTLGYSSLPGAPANLDGVVISYSVFGTIGNLRAPFYKGRTATHEIGHWLGLKHIWGDAICGTDEVDDTPTQQYFNYGCPGFPHVGNCSPNANGDLFMNFMDFTDDACMNLFTIGQKRRMRALFAKNNLRNSFLLSFACDSVLAQAAPLPDAPMDTITKNPKLTMLPAKNLFSASIYPNPATTSITVIYKNGSLPYKKFIHIYNIAGREIFNGLLNNESTNINIKSFSAGIYIVIIADGFNRITLKIIKQ